MGSSRTENIIDLGTVKVTKKRGLKRVNMRVHHSGEIRVSIPSYLPFASGFAFAKSHLDWLQSQKSKNRILKIYPEMQIGKSYTLRVVKSDKLTTRITENEIIIKIPEGLNINSPEVNLKAKQAIKRALNKEAKIYLPDRVRQLANQYNYEYSSVHTKPMKARWGSCSSQKLITLNIYLLMMPWPIIDYVIMHELAHTKHMNHSVEFWQDVASTTPNYKLLKKQIKELQPDIHALYL